MSEPKRVIDSYKCPKCHRESHNPNDVANSYCGHCHVFVEDLRNEQVKDFAHITDLYLTRKDCWTLALLTLFDCKIPEARLVHCRVFNSFNGELIEHAMVEMPASATYEDGSEGPVTVVVDLTQPDPNARILPADFRYEQGGARDFKRFTLAEAMAYAKAAGHDGPWDTAALAEKAAKERPFMDHVLSVRAERAKPGRSE